MKVEVPYLTEPVFHDVLQVQDQEDVMLAQVHEGGGALPDRACPPRRPQGAGLGGCHAGAST